MDRKIEILHKLCEALMDELEEYSIRVEKADGMSTSDLEAVDKLSHALKSIKTTIAMIESEEEDGNSYRGGNSNRYMPMPWYGRMSYEGGRGGQGGNSNRGGMSSARRGRANNPTGRNQYSRDGGYSYAEEDFETALKEAMEAAPDEHMRDKLQRIINEV